MPLNPSRVRSRRPILEMDDAVMAPKQMLKLEVSNAFGQWSSARLAHYLGINVRTIQRWLKEGDGEIPEGLVPPEMRTKIRHQAGIVLAHSVDEVLTNTVNEWLELGIDPEIIASHLDVQHKRLVSRTLDTTTP